MRDDVAWLYRQAARARPDRRTVPAMSARAPPDGMVITPSGGDPETVTAADLSVVTMDGVALDRCHAHPANGPCTPPSTGFVPRRAFIVHTHADACTALACLGSALPAFHYMVLQFGGADVRCAPYVTFGTQALADLAAEAIRGANRVPAGQSRHGRLRRQRGGGAVSGHAAGNPVPAVPAGAVGGNATAADSAGNAGCPRTLQDVWTAT